MPSAARVCSTCADGWSRIFHAHSRRRRIPGLAYGVVLDGELLLSHSFGVREVASGAPADADTAFRIASMTKSFAAAAIVQLRDAGLLALDAPAADYTPELGGLLYPTADSAPYQRAPTAQHVRRLAARRPLGRPPNVSRRRHRRGLSRRPAFRTLPA